MSFIVTGLEIPRDCPACKLAHWNCRNEFTGCNAVPNKRYALTSEPGYAQTDCRPDWCPLRPISEEHGRLIDADELKVMVPSIEDEYKYVHKLIDQAPTVFEREWQE